MAGGWQPNRKEWTEADTSVITDNWNTASPYEIAKMLDRSPDSVIARSRRMGLSIRVTNAWDDAQIAFLCKRWKEGASASVIAGEMSSDARKFTRNSIIGKAHRLTLEARPAKERKKTERLAKRGHNYIVKRPKFKPEPFIARPEPAPEDLIPMRTAILTSRCTFSLREWESKCCGRGRDASTNSPSYCKEHHLRSRIPLSRRAGGPFVLPGVRKVA